MIMELERDFYSLKKSQWGVCYSDNNYYRYLICIEQRRGEIMHFSITWDLGKAKPENHKELEEMVITNYKNGNFIWI